MEDESRLNLNSNGSGVILRLTSGDVSFRAHEFQLYQALFKICDAHTLGLVSTVDNDCLFDLLRGTRLEMGILRKLVSVSTHQIYKHGYSNPNNINNTQTITDEQTDIHTHMNSGRNSGRSSGRSPLVSPRLSGGGGGGEQLNIPDVINFHQWLLLCKLIAYVQTHPHKPDTADTNTNNTSNTNVSVCASPRIDWDNMAGAEKTLMQAILDNPSVTLVGDTHTNTHANTHTNTHAHKNGATNASTNGGPHTVNDIFTDDDFHEFDEVLGQSDASVDVSTSAESSKQSSPNTHKLKQLSQQHINLHHNTIAQFSLCSIQQLHGIRDCANGQHTHALANPHTQQASPGSAGANNNTANGGVCIYSAEDIPTYVVNIVGWEYSDSDEAYQQQHVKFKLQTRVNKRTPMFVPNTFLSAQSSMMDAAKSGAHTTEPTTSSSLENVDTLIDTHFDDNNNISSSINGGANTDAVVDMFEDSVFDVSASVAEALSSDLSKQTTTHSADQPSSNTTTTSCSHNSKKKANKKKNKQQSKTVIVPTDTSSTSLNNSTINTALIDFLRSTSVSSTSNSSSNSNSSGPGTDEEEYAHALQLLRRPGTNSSVPVTTITSTSSFVSSSENNNSNSISNNNSNSDNNNGKHSSKSSHIHNRHSTRTSTSNSKHLHHQSADDLLLTEDECSAEFTKTTTVYRRFSDFERLVEILQSSYPGILIPPLPPKTLQWHSFAFNYAKISDVLLHQRCRDLKMFLDAVCAHKLLRSSFEVRAFLESSPKGYRAFKELFPRFVRGEVSLCLVRCCLEVFESH
jgi:hypothetical protein